MAQLPAISKPVGRKFLTSARLVVRPIRIGPGHLRQRSV